MAIGKLAAKIAKEAAKKAKAAGKKAKPTKKGMAKAAKAAGITAIAGPIAGLGALGAYTTRKGFGNLQEGYGRYVRARDARKNVSTPEERKAKQARLGKARSAELKAREARQKRASFQGSRRPTAKAPPKRPSSTRAPRRK